MFKKRNVKQQPNLNPSKKSGQPKTTGTNGILNPDIFNRIFGKSSTPQTRRKRSPSPSFFPSAKPSSLFAPQPVTRFTPEDEVVPRPPVCSDSTATAEVHPNRIVGLCSKMCPDSFAEIIMLNCNKIFEIGPDGKPDRELFISNNPRCTSDRNNRPEDVRNEIGLKKTYDRIHDAVISFTGTVPHGQLYQIYYYLKEILTMLVKEVKLTKLYSRLSIDILEFSIRFLIIAGYNLCECKDPPFPCKENRDQVKHFLYDLRYIYEKTQDGTQNKAEFYAYSIILDQETLGALPKDLFSDPLVMKAIKVAEAISTNNYFDFFKIMREVPYVMKCLMHALSFEIRKNSIKALTRYKEAKLVELEKKLFFTSINEVNEFAQIFMHTDGNSIPKGANFRDVKDVTLYKIPQIIKDIEPGQELQDMVYNGEKCEKCEQLQTFEQNTVQGPLSLFSPLLQKVQVKPAETTKSKAKEKEEEKAEGEEEEEEEEEKDKAEEKCLAYEKRLEDMKTIEKQRRAKEEEDRKRLEREKELEEIRIKEADKRRKDELRAKKLKEEEEEEDRKRKLKREAEKQEQERKAEERTTKAINKVQGLDFQGIMNKAKCERHCKWKVVAIFQGKAASKQNYAQRFLDRKISFTEDGKNKDIEFVKVYGLENVRENDVYGSQTVILCGDIWDNERLAKVLDKAMYAKGEVIVIYEKSFETHPKLNRKVSLFQVTQTPPPHIKDLEITKELEKIVSASYKRSYEPLKNIGLEKTTLYSYVKAKFEEVSTVKMSTKHLQYWNSPEFFYERTNTVVSMIMEDIVGSRVKSLNMLGYSEPKFMANVRRVLLNLRVPELRWSQLIEQRPLRLDKDFIEKATELFSSFIKQFKIAGTEGAVENFRRILCFVVLNNGQQRSPAQALVNGIHWSGIYSDLMARAIEETIKANDFEVIVDTTINAEKYKTLDKQFENRIKEFLSACAEENVDRNSSEDAEKLQPPAQKKRKYKYETNGIRAEITPLKSVESIVCAEKERWEAEFEAILSGN